MDSEELLSQLADIHLPQQVSYWPPAPGWWVLAVLLLIGAFFLVRKLLAVRSKRNVCEYALLELAACLERLEASSQDLDSAKLHYVNEVNSVLRRVALVHYPLHNVASLGGTAWVDFIREKGDSSLLDEDIANALSHGRFQTRCDVDANALYMLGQAWIRSLYLQKPVVAPSATAPTNTAQSQQGLQH